MTSPQRKFQLRAKAAGKCERCGHDKDSARSRVFCERCRVYRNDQQNRYRARRSAVRRMTFEFAVPVAGREHHSYWFQGLSHPDADLIAAAPDLLAACRLVHALGEAERREGSDALWTDEFRSIFEAANAAIDKAEGRVGGDDAGL